MSRRRQAIIDTSVLRTANRENEDATPDCVDACAIAVRDITERGILVIDDSDFILDEYRKSMATDGRFDQIVVFVTWIFQNQFNYRMVRRVSITRDEANDTFAEFPSVSALTSFDHDDRKFVAVAIATGTKRRPPILNATDSDYSMHREALQRYGVTVEELCPDILKLARLLR